MIVDKNGRVVANVSQPTIIFNKEEDYENWKSNLPDEDDENNFLIIKNFDIKEGLFENLSELKEIPTADRDSNVVYKVKRLLPGLSQEVSFSYDSANDLFVPTTSPIYMSGECYDNFLTLLDSKEEFDNYKLIFPLYHHDLRLDFKFDEIFIDGLLPANSELAIQINLYLPFKKEYTSFVEFLGDYSSYNLRGLFVDDSMSNVGPTYSFVIPATIISTTSENLVNRVHLRFVRKCYDEYDTPWNKRLELEDFNNLDIVVVVNGQQGRLTAEKMTMLQSISDNVTPFVRKGIGY